ncbi:MAG: efflux RND transporter periplasmic adaptor subunit, partial [Lacipirellulaceae bacterium]
SEGTPAKVSLTPAQIELAKITVQVAESASLAVELRVPGEVVANQNLTASILPRVPGVVREVKASLGEQLSAGTVLALIDSRELADAQSAYMAARQRTGLARTTALREEKLWKQKITPEQDYLTAKQAYSEAQIVERAAKQKLLALGLSAADIKRSESEMDGALTLFLVTAPFDGTVIGKNVAQGDLVDGQTALFKFANLDIVWVMGSVYEKDVSQVHRGQSALVTVPAYPAIEFEGTVTWVSDVIDERTRTLPIRVEVNNGDRLLKPGTFANIALRSPTTDQVVAISPMAIQRQGNETIVFVQDGDGDFVRREVKTGIQTAELVEIVEGLKIGDRVVVDGSFILKSELEKAGFGGGHGH